MENFWIPKACSLSALWSSVRQKEDDDEKLIGSVQLRTVCVYELQHTPSPQIG